MGVICVLLDVYQHRVRILLRFRRSPLLLFKIGIVLLAHMQIVLHIVIGDTKSR